MDIKKTIQQAVELQMLCNEPFDSSAVRFNLLNCFLPKPHRFSSQLSPMNPKVVGMLGDVGWKLALLAVAFDDNVNHPDIHNALGGAFKLESKFAQSIDEFLKMARMLVPHMQSTHKNHNFDYFIKKDKAVRKILPRLGTPHVVRFLKEKNRTTCRLEKESFNLDLPHTLPIWERMNSASFWDYVRFNTPTAKDLRKEDLYKHQPYFGFNRITMTNAGVLLSLKKPFIPGKHLIARVVPVVPSSDHSQWSWLPDHAKYVLEKLEEFPDAGNRAIFDYFWAITIGNDSILLGEREKRCYFITML